MKTISECDGLKKRFAREALEVASREESAAIGKERIWLQGTVVGASSCTRWMLDDGSAVVEIDTEALQETLAMRSNVSAGDYVRVLCRAVSLERKATHPHEKGQGMRRVIFKALQVSKLQGSDRDSLWMLEVIRAKHEMD